MAESRELNWPPSEKLSGVTFRMPIKSGHVPKCNVRVRRCQDVALWSVVIGQLLSYSTADNEQPITRQVPSGRRLVGRGVEWLLAETWPGIGRLRGRNWRPG